MQGRIVDAFRALISRYGYRRVTMDDIAREAGVARRTVYLHFAGKEEIARAVLGADAAEYLAVLRSVAESRERPGRRLRQAVIARCRREPTGYDDLPASVVADTEANRRAGEAGVLAGILRDGVAAGVFAAFDPDDVARTLLTATDGAVGRGDDEAGRVADLLLLGVRRR